MINITTFSKHLFFLINIEQNRSISSNTFKYLFIKIIENKIFWFTDVSKFTALKAYSTLLYVKVKQTLKLERKEAKENSGKSASLIPCTPDLSILSLSLTAFAHVKRRA